MALFDWTPEDSVSVQRFDNEHRRLFFLLNQLADALAVEGGRAIVSQVLEELSGYARQHFAGEEEAMRLAGFQGLDEHIAEHRVFLSHVGQYRADYAAFSGDVAMEVLCFLSEWLQAHIRVTDRQYTEALKRAGIR